MEISNTQASLAAAKKKYHVLGWLHNAIVWLLYHCCPRPANPFAGVLA